MCTVCGCGGEARVGLAYGGVRAKRAAGAPAAPKSPDAAHQWRALGEAVTVSGEAPQAALKGDRINSAAAELAAARAGTAGSSPAPTNTHANHHHLHFGEGPARAHVPGMSQGEMLRIERDILGKNDRLAAANRATLAAHGILALNLVSSPGSGKTSLLVSTLQRLAGRIPAAVIEGDQQTEFDAERIRATGVSALQINTGKGCHLDADMIGRALPRLALADGGLLFIENVGNLVCPAAFDLGEAHKVVILSVTEGEDKPLKYPDMFAAADLMLLNKTDLLPYLHFDVPRALEYALRVNPSLQVIQTSATSGEGLDAWLAWLEARLADARRAAAQQAATPA
ncbi:hydrogenase nickel incorporation protein HypB [Thauera sp.]|jgi:hydrogenase nickel incorporation protein HypB|uniref:hydrogenase nickel incorporation protein HypB n=1 Tax=Thauera sp. TaxID=1905334 RepID=UPI002A367EE2|nr:hydrogenase nickel incorporation protein HypB [Thauera sp.]MDX9885905.1 hydrogenase nickel incorporation protein HypB [Thauera sp.]